MSFQIKRIKKITPSAIKRINADAVVVMKSGNLRFDDFTHEIFSMLETKEWLETRGSLIDLTLSKAVAIPVYSLDFNYLIGVEVPYFGNNTRGYNNIREKKIIRDAEKQYRRRCYKNVLNLAYEEGCKSIALPILTQGVYGLSGRTTLQIAREVIAEFLSEHEMSITLLIIGTEPIIATKSTAQDILKSIFNSEKTSVFGFTSFDNNQRMEDHFIDDHVYYDMTPEIFKVHCMHLTAPLERSNREEYYKSITKKDDIEEKLSEIDRFDTDELIKALKDIKFASLGEILNRIMLFKRITTSDFYKELHISRQTLNNTLNGASIPQKYMLVGMAVAMRLNLEETEYLLSCADYAWNPLKKSDYIIKRGIKDNLRVDEINDLLYDAGCKEVIGPKLKDKEYKIV